MPFHITNSSWFLLVATKRFKWIQFPWSLLQKKGNMFDVLSWWNIFVQITQLAKQKTSCAHRRIVWMKRSSLGPLEWEHWFQDYQRTNPRDYQIVRTTQMKPLEYNIRHHPTNSSTLCRTPHLNKKQNKNTNPIISRQDDKLSQPCISEEKQTEAQHRCHPIWSLQKTLDQP